MIRSILYSCVLSVLFFSCDNERVIIEVDQVEYTNKDIESMLNIKLDAVADKSQLDDAIGTKLMRGLKVAQYFKSQPVDGFPTTEVESALRYKLAFEVLTKKILRDQIMSKDYLETFYRRSSKILDIKHLHIQIDTLNSKGYNFTLEEFDNLKRTISEQLHNDPNNIDSYIIKYGYRPDINRNLGISWGYFPYILQNKIYNIYENGEKSTDGFVESPYGSHYVVIIKERENDKFEFKSFSEFYDQTEKNGYSNINSELTKYRKYYFDKLIADAEMEYLNNNIIKSLISMNGLTEEEFDNYQYENLPLATFYLDNKTEKINVMTKDIHYFNFENMFKKIAGLQLKPKLMLVYIENYVSAILAYNDMKKNGYLNQVNDKIIQYETNIMKFDKFKDQLKREVQVSDEEIANFYEKNKSNYVEPPRRKTYGISVTMSDSAKLFADYKKMTVKNLIDYYVKYSPYIKSKKNVKMRLLGDFQKNSFGLISEEAFKLSKPNTLSKIVKYNSLFYVFYYTEESNSRQQELSEVSNLIFDELAEQKYKSKTDSIDQLIDARFADTSHYYKSNL